MVKQSRVALFIDAENIAASHVLQILEHGRSLGKVTIARCYGNDAALKGWKEAIAKHHLMPKLTPPGSSKQNASDFALTIDAVSMLHRDLFDDALLASSDADFTALAIHIREQGKGIYCFGDGKKLKGNYRTVFDAVFEQSAAKAAPTPKKPPKAKTQPAVKSATPIPVAELIGHFRDFAKSGKPVAFQAFGRWLANRLPPDYRKGHGTLSNYLKKSGAFDISKDNVITLRGP